ncbi:MAG: M13 family metallopeptidase [Patescibacteria group bacterium]
MKSKKSTNASWGFDLATIDHKVRPQDDFFRYANGGWIEKNTIPPAESRWGSFITLRYDTEKQLRKILKDLELKKRFAVGTPEQLVRDFYHSSMDMKARTREGTKPIQKWRTLIQKIESKAELLSAIATLHRVGIDVLWDMGVDQDSKNSEKNILHLSQGGLGMPDRDYYLSNEPESERVRAAYKKHIAHLFELLGIKKAETLSYVEAVMEVETRLAKASMNKVDIRDPDKTYHKKTLSALIRHTPDIDWKRYFKIFGIQKIDSVIVCQPLFFKEVEKILSHMPLSTLKVYFEWQLINQTASLLSLPFVEESFNFYGKTLMGTKEIRPLWRRSLSAVNGSLGEALGRLYVAKHFSKAAKKKVNAIVDDLFVAYRERIKALDWMSPKTKKRALVKLRTMTRKLAYPDRWKSYKSLVIEADDYFGNALRVAEFHHRKQLRKLRRPVDASEWHMSPQTVNAYFNPGLNEIVFPAAILQAPFFDPTADDAVNYGAIGYTIGHEITHSFDDQGSKFDEKGNLKSWWTREDRVRFEKKAKVLAKQFDAYEVLPGVHVNGKLTLGENIADLGGISIAYDAYQKHIKGKKREALHGFTPEQRFFLGCAQGEREISRPEFLKTIVMTDPHSPSEFRINGPFSNLPEFYDAFGVQKGDKLYRSPNTRAKIW